MPKRLLKTVSKHSKDWTLMAVRCVLFSVLLLWQELWYRLFCQTFLGRGLGYTLLFVLPIGCLFALLSSLWSQRGNLLAARILMSVSTFWFMVQSVYHTIFGTLFVTSSLSMAGDALGSYWREALSGILQTTPLLLFLLVPPVFLFLLGDRLHWRPLELPVKGGIVGTMAALQLVAVLSLNIPTGGMVSMHELYRQSFLPDMVVANFGVLTSLRLDITQTLFGLEEAPEVEIPTIGTSTTAPVPPPSSGSTAGTTTPSTDGTDTGTEAPPPPPIVYEPNVMDIDFDTLIANEKDKTLLGMHQYFSTVEPTLKNAYTGMFEGKNLIMLTGEAFWIGAVSEKYTPTLYKLTHECFVFNNFYNPLWYYSTVDGEYAHTTGLVPSNQVNASQRYAGKNKNNMYFSMGNQFSELGYPTMAYHNNTATYYDRNLSHPNLGYEFIAADTGLDVAMTWPQSDLEMMELTLPQALEGQLPFHNYYMTVSGHLQYNFLGNKMAMKHKADVADAPYSEAARAYLACNMELDKALEYTLKTLEDAGQLENTVIVLSGDHYPYGLDSYAPAIDELTQEGTQASPWEIHHSSLVIWSGDMAKEEPVIIDKYCSSIDVIPTISNLFGLEYDSRLLAGRDILSTSDGFVPFNNRSYIAELGRYDAATDTFFPNEGAEIPEGYSAYMYQRTKNLLNYSSKILFQDYYEVLGLSHED